MAKPKQKPQSTTFESIKSRAEEIIALQGPVKDKYKEIADLDFMDNTPRINTKAYDGDDIRYTKSPSARNVVVGLHRMLRTSRPQFKIECDDEDWASKMEDALSAWWEASSERKP